MSPPARQALSGQTHYSRTILALAVIIVQQKFTALVMAFNYSVKFRGFLELNGAIKAYLEGNF